MSHSWQVSLFHRIAVHSFLSHTTTNTTVVNMSSSYSTLFFINLHNIFVGIFRCLLASDVNTVKWLTVHYVRLHRTNLIHPHCNTGKHNWKTINYVLYDKRWCTQFHLVKLWNFMGYIWIFPSIVLAHCSPSLFHLLLTGQHGAQMTGESYVAAGRESCWRPGGSYCGKVGTGMG